MDSSISNLDQAYKDAFKEFGDKMRAPASMVAKDSRESSPEKSNYIKKNFKPADDVLLSTNPSASQNASVFFQESKDKSKERLREYLADTVSEFVDTNVLSGDEFYEVLLEVVYDNWQFYKKNADENKVLIKLLQNVNSEN